MQFRKKKLLNISAILDSSAIDKPLDLIIEILLDLVDLLSIAS